jgi:hypothetical protein
MKPETNTPSAIIVLSANVIGFLKLKKLGGNRFSLFSPPYSYALLFSPLKTQNTFKYLISVVRWGDSRPP